MTDLEVMGRAKQYMDKLARGIDPVTDREIPEDSVLNHVRLARCFYYVSDVLGQVIANGGVVGQRAKQQDFVITPAQLGAVPIAEHPIRVTEFTDALYKAVGNPDMKRLNAAKITDWLIARGLLVKQVGPDGKSSRVPTDRGRQMGISTRLRQSRGETYQAVYYDRNMQRFLLDHMEEILKAEKEAER